ncbi:MAG: hypothetical protein JRN36_03495, partial [Nitrososphaerota archaeon]|nr:hypothetical protein [Nitrososphaerota archaeon]
MSRFTGAVGLLAGGALLATGAGGFLFFAVAGVPAIARVATAPGGGPASPARRALRRGLLSFAPLQAVQIPAELLAELRV